MLEDVFVEDSVARHPSTTQRAIAYVFIGLGIAALLFSFLYPPLMTIGWLFAVAFFVVFYFYNRSIDIDFDYSVTNGVFDVAKIISKENRKDLRTVDLKEELVLVAPQGNPSLHGYAEKHLKTLNACGNDNDRDTYCLIAKDSKDSATEYAILFQPNREILQAMHRTKPREVILTND